MSRDRGDSKAIGILMDTFWSGEGWRKPPFTSPDDLDYARSAGVMFDTPISISHDAIVRELVELAGTLEPAAVADAFLVSLATRELERRSALESYAVARLLPEHAFVPQLAEKHLGEPECAVCGLPRTDPEFDLNILNFERFKWGGVRRDDLAYVWFDLRQFAQADTVNATVEDRRLFGRLIEALEALPATTTAPKAEKALRLLRSNRSEREIVLDILGVCGALETPEHRGYSERFVPHHERSRPPLAYVERGYPVCWWKASDGVNRAALELFQLSA